jgi:hypothetical protein
MEGSMKQTGKLKENVEKAETKEQAGDITAKAGMRLSDDELEQVSGGASFYPRRMMACPFHNYRVHPFDTYEDNVKINVYEMSDLFGSYIIGTKYICGSNCFYASDDIPYYLNEFWMKMS